jgi:xanthine/CO dehydrogenase XdhC/CoxF family maturation factor
LVPEDGGAVGDIQDEDVRSRMVEDGRGALALGRSATKAYALPSGAVRVFFDVIRPPVSLVICGAGRDALPVVRMARELGWHVTVVDWRPALATREFFPLAHDIVLTPAEGLCERARLERCDAVLVMTHNYRQDLALLAQLLPSPLPYIGVLGPRARTHELLLELQSQGVAWTDAQLARVHAPVGLDIGAEEPETIALAILAEIQTVLAGRAGGPLRHRAGPIHLEPEPQRAVKETAPWAETQTARDPSLR